MADTALKLVLLGADKSASSALRGVQGEAKKTSGVMGKVGGAGKLAMLGIAGAALAAVPAVVDFAKESLGAFADAEKSQKQLEDAYKRFPKVADVNIETMRRYNQELQRKTGADADDIASGQAVLARYKLTGKQLQEMTPLLVDYANRTGKSIPDAAKTMGKALGGSSKLAKELGFSFKDAKDPTKNYEQIMKGLEGTVGGYTDKLPEAEKKQRILQASFGDLQESVGEKLQPAMMGLLDAGQGVMDWLEQNPEVTEGASAAFDLLGDALKGIWSLIKMFLLPVIAGSVEAFAALVEGAAWAAEALGFGDAAKKLRGTAEGIRAVAKGITAVANAPDPTIEPKVKADKAQQAMAKIDKQIGTLSKKRIELQSKGDTRGVDAIDKKIRDLQRKKNTIAVNADNKAKAKLNDINSQISRLSKRRVEVKSRGDDTGVREIDRKIAALKRRRHEVRVGVGLRRSGPQTARIVQTSGSGSISMRIAASGTPYAPSQALTWVGETGPELVKLPTGARVFSTGQSRAMVNRASATPSGGGDTINIIAPPGTPRAFALLVEDELLKLKQSRGRGGKLRF